MESIHLGTAWGPLAEKINAEHEATQSAALSAVDHARRCGELLIQAKHALRHGDWVPWLRTHCPRIAERTAQAYMGVARACLDNPETAARIAEGTLRGAIESIATPKSAAVADLPAALVQAGCVTFGERVGGSIACMLFESARHPGYWYDINLRHGNIAARPILADGLAILCEHEYYDVLAWHMAPDDGTWRRYVEPRP